MRETNGIKSRTGKVERVLVFFGGSDLPNLTSCALKALSNPQLAYLKVDVVLGSNNLRIKTLKKMVAERPNTKLHKNLPHLADLMKNADLSLGGGGSSLWECCHLGLPSLVSALADNQKNSCNALSAKGLIQYLGSATDVTVEKISNSILNVLNHPDEIRDQSEQMQALIPGDGTELVCTKLLESR